MVRGLDTFAEYFAGDEACYVLIGGVATQLALESADMPARRTRDLDIVLCVEVLDAGFAQKLWAFVDAGGYQVHQQGAEPRCFHRFAKPEAAHFPEQLELFARAPDAFPLKPGSHRTPVPVDEDMRSLSAILLDDAYYRFLQAHTQMLAGVRVVTEYALIPLKARAWLDLSERKAGGIGSVDSKQIKKHRNDVLALAQLLTAKQGTEIAPAIRDDVARFIEAAGSEVTASLLADLRINDTPEDVWARLRAAYGAAA